MATITVTKGLIGVEDINFDTGGGTTANTWNRTTSTGGTQAIHKVTAKAVPIEDGSAVWTATNVEDVLDDIKDGTEDLKLKGCQLIGTTDPATAANIGAIFVKDGAGVAEPWPHYRAESNGDITRILVGAATFKIWVYANTAGEGWVVDSSVTDRVLAIKGGSGSYNVDGGNEAGTWDSSTGITSPSHTHTGPNHSHSNGSLAADLTSDYSQIWYDSVSSAFTADKRLTFSGGSLDSGSWPLNTSIDVSGSTGNAGTGNTGGTAATIQSDSSYRPYAAVGTMQYPDVGA